MCLDKRQSSEAGRSPYKEGFIELMSERQRWLEVRIARGVPSKEDRLTRACTLTKVLSEKVERFAISFINFYHARNGLRGDDDYDTFYPMEYCQQSRTNRSTKNQSPFVLRDALGRKSIRRQRRVGNAFDWAFLAAIMGRFI